MARVLTQQQQQQISQQIQNITQQIGALQQQAARVGQTPTAPMPATLPPAATPRVTPAPQTMATGWRPPAATPAAQPATQTIQPIAQPTAQTRAPELVHQTWERVTGTPWREAGAGGHTTGTAADNLALQRRLMEGWRPQAATAQPVAQPRIPAVQPVAQPAPQPVANQQIVQQPIVDHRTAAERFQQQLEAVFQPPPQFEGLTPEERGAFTAEQAQLKARYDASLETLRRNQQQQRERLLGRFAAAGFSEPGVMEGPTAGTPGLVTRALQETGEGQQRALTDLEQARAGDVLAIERARQAAERGAREAAAQEFTRRQEAMQRNLIEIMQLYEPEIFTQGGRVFERDPKTGETRDITPPEALRRIVEVERGGRRLSVTFDAEGREVGAIDLGPVKKEEKTQPTSFREWLLAGGLEGTGLTYAQWLQRPPGGSETPPIDPRFASPTPPQWFKEQKEQELRMSLIPRELQRLWDIERAAATGGGADVNKLPAWLRV